MTKVNGNGGEKQNIDALKAYYEAINNRRTQKEEKAAETKQVSEFKTEKVEASALDATAAQIWGIQLTKGVDKSDAATTKRLEQAFAGSAFMAALDDLQGIEDNDFVSFAYANVKGCDKEKLAKYLNKPLSQETITGFSEFADALVA